MRYTIREFMESEKRLAVHTPTEEDAIKLCNAFHYHGYKWNNGDRFYNNTNYWGSETAYSNYKTIGTLESWKKEGYEVISMSKIIF